MTDTIYNMVNGELIELTEDELKQREKDAIEAQELIDSEAWINNRKKAYGNWQEQLDEMFHDFDAWKARIQSVKDANPKPEGD